MSSPPRSTPAAPGPAPTTTRPAPGSPADTAAPVVTGEAGGPVRPGRVGVLGPHIVDVLGRPVTEIPPGQDGALLEEIRMTVAGTAGGAAVDLAKLGWDVASFGAIGDDGLGFYLRSQLNRLGVDTSGLVVRPGAVTSATILPIRPNGERPSLHVPGATASMRVDDVDWAALATCDAVLIGGPETMPGLLEPAGLERIAALRAAGVTLFTDFLHGGDQQTFSQLAELLRLVDWALPNAEQLRRMTGVQDLARAASCFMRSGAGSLAVTDGGDGALLVRPGRDDVRMQAFAVRVVDTTGCGDAFNAGLVTALMHGCNPVDAVLLGNACGALVAGGLGSDAGIVDLAGVLEVVAAADQDAAGRITARIAVLATDPPTADPLPV